MKESKNIVQITLCVSNKQLMTLVYYELLHTKNHYILKRTSFVLGKSFYLCFYLVILLKCYLLILLVSFFVIIPI